MTRLNLRELTFFVAVARTLNFTRAADELHMAQPPLSRAIRKLEEAVGLRLFERDTHRVALTRAGELLLPRATRILRDVGEAEARLTRQVEPGSTCRIGLTTSVEAGTFESFTTALQKARLPRPPQFVHATSPKLCKLLGAGRLEAAVIALPTGTGSLRVTPLGAQPMIVALSTAHPLARRRRLALGDLQDEAVFWFERARQPAFFDHCQALFTELAFAPRFLREPADHHVLLAEVAAGRGLALLPESFVALKLPGVAYRRLAEGHALRLLLGIVTNATSASGDWRALACRVAQRTLGDRASSAAHPKKSR